MPLINFSGIASGIDSESLIKATSDAAKAQRVTPLETKITDLSDTNTALDDLTTKLTKLQTTVRDFTTLNGGGVSKIATSSDESKYSAVATKSALAGTYSITVNALAQNGTLSFGPSAGTFTSSSDTISAGASEVITIGTGSNMETVTVPITAGVTTISDFVSSFNNQSAKATAALVNVGTSSSPSYKIVINSDQTGTENGTIATTTHAAGFSAATTNAATDASITVAGIGTITRATNSINDVISGVTLDLRSTGAANLSVTVDNDATISAMQDLVSAWNDIVSYIAEKNLITRQEDSSGATNIFGPLSTTRVDDNALSSLRSALASTNISTSADTLKVRIMADLGITTQRDGTLLLNTDTLKSALSSESSSVNSILEQFADTISLTGGTIDQYTRFNGLIDSTINVNKDQITNLNQRIVSAQQSITKQEDAMRQRFARLESNIGRLQSQQSSLTSALASLG